MKRSWTITLFKHEQPVEAVWREVVSFVTAWNQYHMPQFTEAMGFMWHINFDNNTIGTMELLLQQLKELKHKSNIVYHLSSRGFLEDEDYQRADFIQITGVMHGTQSQPFLLNPDEAVATSSPCKSCGWQDAFDTVQQAAFVIDETLLDKPIDNEAPIANTGWDLVELPTGHMLVSQRLSELLEHHRVDGYQLFEVINAATGRPSKRMFQIVATKVVLTPCMEHSRIEGAPFCASCGAAHGDLEGYFWIRDDWVGDEAVISRHPSGAVMIYLDREIYRQFISAKLHGIHRNDIMFCCHHE